MKKRSNSLIESRWFVHVVVPLASAAFAWPLSIAWLMGAGDDWVKIAVGVAPLLSCAAIGYVLFRIIIWLVPSG